MERILVVDDEAGIASTVKAYFEREGWSVDLACTGSQALSLFKNSQSQNSRNHEPHEVRSAYSLAVLDLMLPDISGMELCRRFRAASPIPVIMLTARTGPDAAAAGLDAGADDYIEKPFSPRELLARAKAVLRRSVPVPGNEGRAGVLAAGNLEIDKDARLVRKDGRRLVLTATEWQILELLASRAGRIFTRSEIVDHALGDDFEGFDRTVDVHIRNLRKKLENDPGHPGLIETVRGLGYRLGVPE